MLKMRRGGRNCFGAAIVALLFLLLIMKVNAEESEELQINGTVLERYLGTEKEVVIPDGVEQIGDYAFADCSNLVSVEIPETVKVIGNEAFTGCENLERVQIPSGVNKIGKECFNGCWHLTEISIPEGVTVLEEGVFRNCANLRSVSLPEGLPEIRKNAFRGCKKLENIALPNGLKEIGYAAFSNCRRLETVVIPESVTTIGSYAFWSCRQLADIEFLSDKTEIGDGKTYYRTPWLERMLAEQPEEEPFLIAGGTLVQARLDLTGTAVVPEGVTKIAAYAFEEAQFQEVLIPETVTEIGTEAFSGNECLESLFIPDSVILFGECVFSDCTALKKVRMSDNITQLRRFCYNCPELTEIELPKNLNSLAAGFLNCPKLKRVVAYPKLSRIYSLINGEVAKNVSSEFRLYVEKGSFAESYAKKWEKQERFRISYGYIGEENSDMTDSAGKNTEKEDLEKDFEIQDGVLLAYHGQSTEVVIPEGVTEIGERAFGAADCLYSVTFPKSLRKIGAHAFLVTPDLRKLEFPDGLEEIGDNAFGGCRSLKEVTFPESLRTIGKEAFSGCSVLKKVKLPENLTKIGERAFASCTSLVEVEIPENVTDLVGKRIFFDTAWLTDRLAEQPDETPFVILNGVLLAVRPEDMKGSIVIPEGVTKIAAEAFAKTGLSSVTLPESLEEIGAGAFQNCKELEQVILPASMKQIGKQAFSGCQKLQEIVLPDGITELEESVFQNCTSLRKVLLPDSITVLKESVFRGCKRLKEVEASKNLKQIGYAAFSNCQKLERLAVPVGVTTIGSYAFWNCKKLAELELPATLTDAGDGKTYYNTPWLKNVLAKQPEEVPFFIVNGVLIDAREDLETAVSVPEGVTRLAPYSMANTAFTGITLPDTVAEIGQYAFYQCQKLERLYMEDSVQSIGKRAFFYCSQLKEIRLSDTVKFLEDAFYFCSSLEELNLPEQLEEVDVGVHQCPSLQKLVVHGKLKKIRLLVWASREVSPQFVCYVEKGSKAEAYVKSRMPYACLGEEDVIYYRIKEGDTLKSIAKTFLGDKNRYTEIMERNKLKSKSLMGKTGKRLLIPIK